MNPRDERDEPSRIPEITVVVPVRDATHVLGGQLEALARQQTSSAWELVIADNGSSDDVAAFVAERESSFPVEMRVVDASRAVGINVARNEGIRAARGRFVLLCDADDLVVDGWIEEYARVLDGADLAGGPIDVETLNSPRAIARRPIGAPTTQQDVLIAIGANLGFRREVWEALGGFDERFRFGGFDEWEFFYRAQRAGRIAREAPGALVRYRLRADLRGFVRQVYGVGRGEAQFRRLLPGLLPASPLKHQVPQLARSIVGLGRRAVTGAADTEQALGFVAFQCGRLREHVWPARP